MKELQLIDRYNRNLNYLRVSITDRCNLRCMYCSPPRNHIPRLAHAEVLSYEEILHIIRIGAELGINKIRITGGEPLARKGVYDFLEKLSKIPGISDISLTTNAVLLKDNIEKIKNAGIKRLNISLDTLNPEKFKTITGYHYFKQVWEGIEKAHELGFHPIKINTVAMKGVNDDELVDIARISLSYPFYMRFIEYMPIGDTRLDKERHLLANDILEILSGIGELVPVHQGKHDGPAERYQFKNAKGEIGLIRPLSHHFCNKCNRLRLTASGHLRPCLLSDRQEDIKTPIRNHAPDEELVKVFFKAVGFKPLEHHLDKADSEDVRDSMSSIGG